MKYLLLSILPMLLISCKNSSTDDSTINFPKQEIQVVNIPNKERIWVFIMAGQSNMAGRGFVAPQDTISNNRILTINKKSELIYAKEPFHFYEPSMAGLDLGMSFGKEVISKIPDSISVLILPTAVGGSSIEQWLENKKHRNVELLANFKNKVAIGKTYGKIKGILWHQGESNTKEDVSILNYDKNLSLLFSRFREIIENKNLPIIIGELGSFSKNEESFKKLNSKIRNFTEIDTNVKVVHASDLTDRGDQLHFDAKSIRVLGKRYAEKMLELE